MSLEVRRVGLEGRQSGEAGSILAGKLRLQLALEPLPGLLQRGVRGGVGHPGHPHDASGRAREALAPLLGDQQQGHDPSPSITVRQMRASRAS